MKKGLVICDGGELVGGSWTFCNKKQFNFVLLFIEDVEAIFWWARKIYLNFPNFIREANVLCSWSFIPIFHTTEQDPGKL